MSDDEKTVMINLIAIVEWMYLTGWMMFGKDEDIENLIRQSRKLVVKEDEEEEE